MRCWGDVRFGVVPAANRHGGILKASLEAIQTSGLVIVDAIELTIQHYLWALPGVDLGAVHELRSHPQAFAQCSNWLTARDLAGQALLRTACASTAAAVVSLVADRNCGAAAIASRDASLWYTVRPLLPFPISNRDNRTLFLVVAASAGRLNCHSSGHLVGQRVALA